MVAAEGTHGFLPALTSFVGRAQEVEEVAGLLGKHRLVTVTGPGGVGKSRLASEVVRRVAGQFADGAWLVELAAVGNPAMVAQTVAAALGAQQRPGTSITESLATMLARQQVLLVLDNCEHVLDAVAGLCVALLPTADDVRVLATSRESIRVAGEARYRLLALPVPGVENPGDGERSEAVALFADRAQLADPHFMLTLENRPAVGRLVARLDGMPLAIELAAARVEGLGVVQLLDRLDNRFRLLVGGDRTAITRQRSLEATVDWSYQLLNEVEQLVFRRLTIFPGPFTLDAAEAVAGAGSEQVVLHLVDCSLIAPPRSGPDGRGRYLMLETLRAFGLEQMDKAAERPGAAAALVRHSVQTAERAAAVMETSQGELAAVRWLDAEDAAMHQALVWALEYDLPAALPLAIALSPWWRVRGRAVEGYRLLSAAAGQATPGSDLCAAAQYWLARLAISTGDVRGALDHCTAALDALGSGRSSPLVAATLAARANSLTNLGRVPEGAQDARRALALARQIGYPAGEAMALAQLGLATYGRDAGKAVEWGRQACQIDATRIPGSLTRTCITYLTLFLLEAGDVAAAHNYCADGLALARAAGDRQDQVDYLELGTDLDLRSGQLDDASLHLREALALSKQIGGRGQLAECVDYCGHLCALTGRLDEAITLWAAYTEWRQDTGTSDQTQDVQRRQESQRKASQTLGTSRAEAAKVRGTAMDLDTAVEFAIMLTGPAAPAPQAPAGLGELSAREQELVALVARGRTDNQIAGQLYITVSTVRSHLDRIRDKTSYRRRADLTRLALEMGLV